MLVGALILLIGLVIGFAVGRAHRQAPPELPVHRAYRCGCKHHLSRHDPQTGKCKAIVDWYVDDAGEKVYEPAICDCQHYVGELPAELMLAAWRPQLPAA